MKKKRNLRTIIGVLLILIGIGSIAAGFGMKYYGKWRQEQIAKDFLKKIQNLSEGETGSATDTAGATGSPSANVDDPSKPGAMNGSAIAILKIPKIDLSVAVVQGVGLEDLKYAVGHFEESAMPGEKGNFAVAGHRSYTYNEYFNRADELQVGDTIEVTTAKGNFVYEVFKKETVEPEDVSVIQDTGGFDSTITLITCTPPRIATHRLIIKGKLMKK